MSKRKALIIGVNGMDGSYLAELLLQKNYEVYGLNHKKFENKYSFQKNISYIEGNLQDQSTLTKAIKKCNPNEIYNFGANSFLEDCWNNPETNADVIGMGVLRLLEAVKNTNKKIKIFQASSSEMFGRITSKTVNDKSRFEPKTQYGCSKLFAHWMCKNYRDYYNMYICNGILFNHESERRNPIFVTRKITQGVAKIHLGLEKYIHLGNLETKKDWGYAPDYMEAVWKMMQQKKSDDYVLCTGIQRTIKDFVAEAFKCVNIFNWEKHIKIDKKFYRPSEVDVLKGDGSKARKVLNWHPKTSFKDMVSKMVQNDINLLKK